MLNGSAKCGVAAGMIALVMDAAYLTIIVTQGNEPVVGVVVAVAVVLALAGTGAIVGSVAGRAALLWPSAASLWVLGMLGMFSIGLPLLIAAGLALIAAAQV